MAETRDSALVSDAVAGAASGQQPIPSESGAQGDEDLSGRAVLMQNLYIFVAEESTKTVATSEAANTEQTKTQINGDIAVTCINLSLSEVVSLLGLADDDEVLAGTSEESRKRALWQFYSTGMLTHSHSDGEFPIYSQDTDGNEVCTSKLEKSLVDRQSSALIVSGQENQGKPEKSQEELKNGQGKPEKPESQEIKEFINLRKIKLQYQF
ncbi:hypothetical protein ALC60_09548 [Trachymyrmex zeteki]|uniref:Uncharacterized protein n=1 Tax=Mycetomoellerius zeteki TaxID=64791 RepID=A0A151WTX1_9HYME|nr:hypothetical protein ALC60_09548 [Trachymyrmex zeteki]